MVGKHILPWFGGGAGVWTLCLAFYQTTLFLGYAYAHVLVRSLPVLGQLLLHAALIVAAFLVLPVLPGDAWKPTSGGDPSGRILAMLIRNVALPFLVLSSTGPLVQTWFARRLPNRSPYPLYALSNAGSLLALLVYPFVVEPKIGLSQQSPAWSGGFALACAAVLFCAWLAYRSPSASAPSGAIRDPDPHAANSGLLTTLLWLALPGCAVMLLMGITNRLCVDIASVPFLWIAPLSLYLLTLILCFASPRFYHRGLFAVVSLVLLAVLFGRGASGIASGTEFVKHLSFGMEIAAYLCLLFSTCMLLHGELYRLRPAAESITRFYLCVSGGGAIAGIFVGILAPRIFDAYHELPLALAACWLLVLIIARRETPAETLAGWGRVRRRAVEALTLLVLAALVVQTLWVPEPVRIQKRNFFGVLRVIERDTNDSRKHTIRMMHGTTLHGVQFRSSRVQERATSYYGTATGIGLALTDRERGRPLQVGIIGLGIGTLAAYGLPGDEFTFYEIDPEVVRISRDDRYFTYLKNSAAQLEVVEGDARLMLESSLRGEGGKGFDILVVDAFSGDSVPIHLLTKEAFQLYKQHLRPGGLVAFHISNRRLLLTPLVFRVAQAIGLDGLEVVNITLPKRTSARSKWVFLSENAQRIDDLEAFIKKRQRAFRLPGNSIIVSSLTAETLAHAPLWTDDYSDLFSVIK
ncbi:MAG: ferrichrome ABC transporter permease [Deltaproteobacteria bacterium]|nr:ferrichrome ABC transporter permease [Deltaproteobacteria bacterium]